MASYDDQRAALEAQCKAEFTSMQSIDGKDLILATLHYVHRIDQKDIAQIVGIKPPAVSRGIKRAKEKGFIQFGVAPPLEKSISAQLETRLAAAFGIRKVLVTAHPGHDRVGYAAAAHFSNCVGAKATLVLDGGKTVEKFVEGLVQKAHCSLTVVPIAADPPSYDFSALEWMVRLSTKWKDCRLVKIPHLANLKPSEPLTRRLRDVQEVARTADVIVLGIGPWRKGCTAQDFIGDLGLAVEDFPQATRALCGYFALNAEGANVPLEDLEKLMPHAIDFQTLQALAGDPSKHVMLLAASAEKAEAVQLALKARICNTVVIDLPLASSLANAVESASP